MLNDIHASLLANALNKLLGKAEEGNIAYIRCLDPAIVRSLCASPEFDLKESTNAREVTSSVLTTR